MKVSWGFCKPHFFHSPSFLLRQIIFFTRSLRLFRVRTKHCNLSFQNKHLIDENAALTITEDVTDSDDEMDELQLRMAALQSATRAVAAREEKENKEELLLEVEKENGM